MLLLLASGCYANRRALTGTIPSLNLPSSFGDVCIIAKASSLITGAPLSFYVSPKKLAVESGSIITKFLCIHPFIPPSIHISGDSSNYILRRAKGVPGCIIYLKDTVLFTFVLSKAWSRFTS
jgi:hypothetical protein